MSFAFEQSLFNENDIVQIARNILIFNKFENRRLINCCKGLIWMYGTDSAASASAPVAATTSGTSQRDSASSELEPHKLSTTNKKTDSGYGASTVSSEDTEDDASSSTSSTTTVDDDMSTELRARSSSSPPPPVVVNQDDDLHQHRHHHHHYHDEHNKTSSTPTTSIFVCGDYKSLESCRDIENELVKLDNRILRVKYSRMYEPSLEQIFTCIKSSDCVLIGNFFF